MRLENQVCSLELAKKLKELGVKQESIFYWELNKINPAYTPNTPCFGNPVNANEWAIPVSAFTVAELGEMLPPTVDGKYNDKTRWFNSRRTSKACVWYDNERPDEQIMIEADTEADARAKMLIYLLENNLLKVAQINQPE